MWVKFGQSTDRNPEYKLHCLTGKTIVLNGQSIDLISNNGQVEKIRFHNEDDAYSTYMRVQNLVKPTDID